MTFVIRHGGDEFLCVLPGMRASAAQSRMREVNQWLDRSYDFGDA